MSSARRVSLMFLVGLLCGLAFFLPAAWMKGYRVYVIHTGSMEPTFPLGTAVIDRPVGHLKPGDVITFRHSDTATDVVTHRIVAITAAGIETKGDANPSPDPWIIRRDQVKGQRLVSVPKLGYFLVFLQRPAGIASVVLAAISMFLLWALFFPSAEPVRRKAAHRASRRRPATRLRPSATPLASIQIDDQPTTVLSRTDLDALRQLLA